MPAISPYMARGQAFGTVCSSDALPLGLPIDARLKEHNEGQSLFLALSCRRSLLSQSRRRATRAGVAPRFIPLLRGVIAFVIEVGRPRHADRLP